MRVEAGRSLTRSSRKWGRSIMAAIESGRLGDAGGMGVEMKAVRASEPPSMLSRPDGTIVWANSSWCDMCGFVGCEDVIGRNIRCIQGPGTDRAQLKVSEVGIEISCVSLHALSPFRSC